MKSKEMALGKIMVCAGVTGLILYLFLTGITAWMISAGHMDGKLSHGLMLGNEAVASLLVCVWASRKTGKKILIVCSCICGGMIMSELMIAILAFGGQIENQLNTVLATGIGGALACGLSGFGTGRHKAKKRHYR